MKKILFSLFLFTFAFFLQAQEDSPLILGGKTANGNAYGTTPGFYSSLTSSPYIPQIGSNGQINFRVPPYTGENSTINFYNPGPNACGVLVPNLITKQSGFGPLVFRQKSFFHISSRDLLTHFVLLDYESSPNSNQFSPYLAVYSSNQNMLTKSDLPASIQPESARLALSDDSSAVLVYSPDAQFHQLYIWNGSQLSPHPLPLSSETPITAAAFAGGGNTLFCIQNRKLLRLDNLKGGQPAAAVLLNLQNPPRCSLQCSDNGEQVIFANVVVNNASSLQEERQYFFQLTWTDGKATGHRLDFINPDLDYFDPALTPDGRFLAFSRKNTAAPNASRQIYRWDFHSSSLQLISTLNNESASGDCLAPCISPDGRQIAFISKAPNFLDHFSIPRDVHQIFIKQNIPEIPVNPQSETYSLISCTEGNPLAAPSKKAIEHQYKFVQTDYQGKKISFWSTADLSSGNIQNQHIYLRDMAQPEKLLLDSQESFPAISGDGTVTAAFQNGEIHFSDGSIIAASLDRPPLLSRNGKSHLYIDVSQRKIIHSHSGRTAEVYQIPGSGTIKTTYPLWLSADGSNIIYLNSDEKKLIFRNFNGISQVLPLLSVKEAAVSANGTLIYAICQDTQIRRYHRLTKTTSTLAVSGPVYRMKCSGNGRILTYIRDSGDGRYALYRYDTSTGKELLLSSDIELNSLNTAVDFTGQKIVFSSPDTFNSIIQDDNKTNDLYMVSLSADANNSPDLNPPANPVIVDYAPQEFYFTFWDSDGDDAALLQAEITSGNARVQILPPDGVHPWYGVRIQRNSPDVSPVTLRTVISDGQDSLSQDLVFEVRNTPVWKQTPLLAELSEQTGSHILNPGSFASDLNTDDKLAFLIVSKPDSIPFSISTDEQGRLLLSPGHDVVSHAEQSRTFAITLKVTDSTGLSTREESMTLRILDKDQPPVIALKPGISASLSQNSSISSAWFQCSDPDTEDQDESFNITLRIPDGDASLQSQNASGKSITIPAGTTDADVTYRPGSKSYTDQIHVTCSDRNGAAQSEALVLTVHLSKINDLNPSDFWELSADGSSSSPDKIPIRAGHWNLLSLPVTVHANALQAAFPGSVIRWWNAAEQRYLIADASTLLPAGTGFWLYCDALPEALPKLAGERSLEAAYTSLTPGWHLLGPIQGLSGDFTEVLQLFPRNLPVSRYQAPIFLKPDSNYIPPTGTAAWIWKEVSEQ